MGPPWMIDLTTHRTVRERSYHGGTYLHPTPSHTNAKSKRDSQQDGVIHLHQEAMYITPCSFSLISLNT